MVETEQPENLAKTYVRSTSIGWLRIALVRGTQIFYIALMARWLTTTEQGFVQSVALGINLVAGVVTTWIAWVLTQKVLSSTDKTEAQSLIYQLTVYGIILSLTIAPTLAFLYSITTPGIGLSEAGILLILVATVMCLNVLGEAIYVSFFKIERSLLIGAGRLVASYVIPLGLFFLTGNVIMIFWGWLIADIVVVAILFITSGLKRDIKLYQFKLPSKALVIFTTPILIIYIFRTLRSFLDRYIILIFMGGTELATYHLVVGITTIASEAILTLLIPFFPIMTLVFAKRQERIGVALGATIKMLLHAIILVVPIFVFAGLPIIDLILGPRYVSLESVIILAIASFSMSFLAFAHVFFRTKEAKGGGRILVVFEFLFVGGQVLFLTIFLFLGWLTWLGPIAVVLSVALGNLLALAFMASQTKELRLIQRTALLRTLFLALPITLIVYFLSSYFFPLDLIDVLLITGLSFLTLVILSGVLSCFTNEDLSIVAKASHRLRPLIIFYRKLGLWRKSGENQT